jgi:uroporphyrinogen-III decarboxylase
MSKDFYLDLAKSGKRIPLATHLVLHELADPQAALLDGARLAAVAAESARRFGSPVAFPIMDLTIEKAFMLRAMGIGAGDPAAYHFSSPPSGEAVEALERADPLSSGRMAANCASLRELAASGGPAPIGMSIGPFSLLTKLLSDPIIPVYLAGSGVPAEESEEVALLQALLPLCESVVLASCRRQIEAGAAAIFVCEPAANEVFFSPKQLAEGSSVFADFVIEPNMRLKSLLDSAGADLLFHDCGSLTPGMVSAFAELDPALLSLGSAVKLWELEPYVPESTVIFGNLPTKKFYSDEEVPVEAVSAMVREIEDRLGPSGHPFIVGSECDILSMPGYEDTIRRKVEALCSCPASRHLPLDARR